MNMPMAMLSHEPRSSAMASTMGSASHGESVVSTQKLPHRRRQMLRQSQRTVKEDGGDDSHYNQSNRQVKSMTNDLSAHASLPVRETVMVAWQASYSGCFTSVDTTLGTQTLKSGLVPELSAQPTYIVGRKLVRFSSIYSHFSARQGDKDHTALDERQGFQSGGQGAT